MGEDRTMGNTSLIFKIIIFIYQINSFFALIIGYV